MLSGEQNAIGTKFLILVQSMESMLFMSKYNIAMFDTAIVACILTKREIRVKEGRKKREKGRGGEREGQIDEREKEEQ